MVKTGDAQLQEQESNNSHLPSQDKESVQLGCPAEEGQETPQVVEENGSLTTETKVTADENKEGTNLEALQSELESISNPEEKLKKTMFLMESSLAQDGNPNFKIFWESKKKCLALFKEQIPPTVKASYWSKYRELTTEAKRLKEILEEQSAFAIEQIEMAINALESDIQDYDNQLAKFNEPEFPQDLNILKENRSKYFEIQKELNLLNTYASRINTFRKELIRTQMRIRQKNKFFKRLSDAGDHVFPRRKEHIKQISQLFIDDIDAFMSRTFSEEKIEKSLYPLRENVKTLQAVAKILTLNTHAFTHTRKTLSEFWDKLRKIEKERKKEHQEKKLVYKTNAEAVRKKIKAFKESVNTLSVNEAQKQTNEISKYMRTVDLGRDEVRSLKEELNQAFQPIKDKLKEEEKKRREAQLEKEQKRQVKIKEIEEQAHSLIATLDSLPLSEVTEKLEGINKEIQGIDLNKFERNSLTRLLVPIKDSIAEKQEEELFNLSDNKKEVLKQLNDVLQRKKVRREEIKRQVDKFRKACGSSGLDFEQSMFFNEQLNAEKDRLEKISLSIEETEAKIAEIKKSA